MFTDDPNHPGLKRGVDKTPQSQSSIYLILSEEERRKGFIRPVRKAYIHTTCGAVTTMALALAETYARNPTFYGSTYCTHCQMHLPVGEFRWDGTNELVGS